jgi:hypothetical protein
MPTEPSDNLENVIHWPFALVLLRIGMAVAVGVLVGLELEHEEKTGVRTFSMIIPSVVSGTSDA